MTVRPSAVIAVCRTALTQRLCANVALAVACAVCPPPTPPILHTNTSPAVLPQHMCVASGASANRMNQMSHLRKGKSWTFRNPDPVTRSPTPPSRGWNSVTTFSTLLLSTRSPNHRTQST